MSPALTFVSDPDHPTETTVSGIKTAHLPLNSIKVETQKHKEFPWDLTYKNYSDLQFSSNMVVEGKLGCFGFWAASRFNGVPWMYSIHDLFGLMDIYQCP